nr:hypothetical protein [Acinetobacter guerrae]
MAMKFDTGSTFEMSLSMDAFLTQRLSKLVLIPCSNATLAIEV